MAINGPEPLHGPPLAAGPVHDAVERKPGYRAAIGDGWRTHRHRSGRRDTHISRTESPRQRRGAAPDFTRPAARPRCGGPHGTRPRTGDCAARRPEGGGGLYVGGCERCEWPVAIWDFGVG